MIRKSDIIDQDDVKLLVDSFYEKVVKDKVIGYFFTEVMIITWDNHIPRMYAFWETVLLQKGTYRGHPPLKHVELNRLEPLKQEHFTVWRNLWEETVDELFLGPVADDAKRRAEMMEKLLLFKIEKSQEDGFIM